MNFVRTLSLSLVVWLPMTGCAMQKYRAAPISPAESAASLESRALQDHGLEQFLERNLGHAPNLWPLKTWDLDTLTLAALYFNPEMEVARERTSVAQAAIITAGSRPNPTLSLSPGIPSPYLFDLNFSVPIETAGKRGHRIVQAERLSDAARFDLGYTAWTVRSRVRSALLDYLMSGRSVELLQSQERLLQRQVELLQQRLAVGQIPRSEVDAAAIQLSSTRLVLLAGEGRIAETRVTLTAAIGIPVAALEGIQLEWANLDSPPAEDSFSVKEIQREALLNRLDVRAALARYEAAQAGLQLEIAKQYPDVQIGPGYAFEEADNFFTLGLSLRIPILNRNQGPIAEAEARRKEAAAKFLATQAQVIAESERALAAYRAALKELNEADRTLTRIQRSREQLAKRALELGESDALAYNRVQLQATAAGQARLDALVRAQTALGRLESAMQSPVEPGTLIPGFPYPDHPRESPQQERKR
jgi:cobalt-zinc-cadmium efflux system outer membrane protein